MAFGGPTFFSVTCAIPGQVQAPENFSKKRNIDLTKYEWENNPEKLAIREKQLQEKINQQISSNEGELSSKDDLTLLAENQLLVQKVKESKRREESYQNGIIEISEDEDENSTELQALRQEMLKDNNEEVLAIHSDIDALKKQKATLTIYNNDLISSLTEVEKS